MFPVQMSTESLTVQVSPGCSNAARCVKVNATIKQE